MEALKVRAARVAALALLALAADAPAAEMKLSNGQRVTVLVESCDEQGNLTVYLTSGEKQVTPLREVAVIYYSGRPEHFIRTGDQRLVFTAGGTLCGQVENMEKGDTLHVASQSLGRHIIPLACVDGFTAMANEGRAARLAEDLLSDDADRSGPGPSFLDTVLDRRGVPYAGVLEKFTAQRLEFEHDEQLQQVRIDTYKVAGARLAEAAKQRPAGPPSLDDVQVGIHCRDRSHLVGRLAGVDPFQWRVKPGFDPARTVTVPGSEITRVEILGGRTVFLTQLDPVKVQERTIIAPPQPFRRNTNSQGEGMDVGGFIYHNGLGVHSSSVLTYRLDGRFKKFLADVGIDGRLEQNGSVVFIVRGDGRELFRSPVVRGRIAGGGLPVEVSVEGVGELTLEVAPTEDLDQSDVANWGAARVVR